MALPPLITPPEYWESLPDPQGPSHLTPLRQHPKNGDRAHPVRPGAHPLIICDTRPEISMLGFHGMRPAIACVCTGTTTHMWGTPLQAVVYLEAQPLWRELPVSQFGLDV
jgi:hypothetical protein